MRKRFILSVLATIITILIFTAFFFIEEILGLVVLFFSMIIQVIVPPIPAELIVISAGKLYGVTATTIVARTGLYFGSIMVYFFGRQISKYSKGFFEKKQ